MIEPNAMVALLEANWLRPSLSRAVPCRAWRITGDTAFAVSWHTYIDLGKLAGTPPTIRTSTVVLIVV
jgi:hypothetical protein